ncbi:MAG TPA: DUF177 domain-containing protein [Verrucomicrobiae bacterium]|nr:DUF177 domain-containing protein [Verrucomicrobiae bacterium]
MKINVKRIPPGGEILSGADPASIMDLDETDVHFEHEVGYKFLAQIQGNALLVTGHISTPATLRCSRCLRVFEQPLHVKQFVFHQELHGEDFVDLTAQMREDIILELPQRALCAEDCKGLCPRCGQDLNQGPCRCRQSEGDLRWHPLDNLNLKPK